MADNNNAQGTQNTPQTTAETQPNATPAETGGKTFTQEEVNQIVADRLARERSKATGKSDPLAEKEQALNARENRLKCRELISCDKHYPPQLLDLIDTADFSTFKAQADKFLKAFPSIAGDAHTGMTVVCTGGEHGAGIGESAGDPIGEAFRRR